jgi:hypothetical protein
MEQKQMDKVRDAMQQLMTYLKIGGPLLRATASIIFCTPIFLVVTIASILLPILLLLIFLPLLLAHHWEIAQMTKAAQMHGYSRR